MPYEARIKCCRRESHIINLTCRRQCVSWAGVLVLHDFDHDDDDDDEDNENDAKDDVKGDLVRRGGGGGRRRSRGWPVL